MVNAHSKSFFGQKVGIILLSSSETDPFIFLKFFKKKANNEWEKPSKGEGKTVKISIEEMVTLLDVKNSDDSGTEVRAKIKRSTDKAVLLAFKNGSEAWFPKSSICSDFGDSQTFLIKKWILVKNNVCDTS